MVDRLVIVEGPYRTEVGVGAEDLGEESFAADRLGGLGPNEVDGKYRASVCAGARYASTPTSIAQRREFRLAADEEFTEAAATPV